MAFAPPLWSTRKEAGAALAHRFGQWSWPIEDTMVLALPRGGVPVAAEMAHKLGWKLGSWCVRKVADPAYPELAMGAVAAGGVVVWRDGGGPIERHREQLAREKGWLQMEERELARRQALFGDPDPSQLRGRHLVVVDDGIATGMTVRAALLSLQQVGPASLTLAVPVVDREVVKDLQPLVNRLEVVAVVDNLQAVGLWYRNFDQLSDAEVLELLARRQAGAT